MLWTDGGDNGAVHLQNTVLSLGFIHFPYSTGFTHQMPKSCKLECIFAFKKINPAISQEDLTTMNGGCPSP